MTRHLVRGLAVTLVVASCSHDSTAPTPPAGTFHIVIQNVGPAMSPAAQVAFDSAVATWQRVITASLPPIANFSDTANACAAGFPAYGPATINDIVIQVRLDSIDGVGKVLGHSGPCFVRSAPDNRPVFGTMTLDSADVASLNASGHLREVVLHEMAHVLGFGTLWIPSYANCVQLPVVDTTAPPDTYYTCAHARAQFDSIGGTSYTGGNKVPVENCKNISNCGAGTYNSHWRESVFFNELMTGFLNNGTPNPLSTLTVAAMEDLGYTVDKNAAQAYSRTFTSSMPSVVAAGAGVIDLSGDITTGPIRMVDPTGRVVGVLVR